MGSRFAVEGGVQFVDDGLQVVAEVFAEWPSHAFIDGLHECEQCRSGAIFGSVGFGLENAIDNVFADVWKILPPCKATTHL